MIQLSYSTITALLDYPHTWLNKQMGIKVPDNEYFKAGRKGHRVIQDHVIGKVLDPRLEKWDIELPVFEIAEEVDFDERCRFVYPIDKDFELIGFLDAHTPKKYFGEIKITSKPWSLRTFMDSMQRRIYTIAGDFPGGYLINSTKDFLNPRIFWMDKQDDDKEAVDDFVAQAIKIIKSGDFKPEEKCGGKCAYKENCQYAF